MGWGGWTPCMGLSTGHQKLRTLSPCTSQTCLSCPRQPGLQARGAGCSLPQSAGLRSKAHLPFRQGRGTKKEDLTWVSFSCSTSLSLGLGCAPLFHLWFTG